MTSPSYPPTPMLDKMLKVVDDSHKIGDFLDWLQSQEIHLGKRVPKGNEYPAESGFDPVCVHAGSFDDLLHQYFEIDAQEEEKERRAVLEYVKGQRKGVTNEP